LRLDTARNQLLITNTVISVIALAFSFGSYVGSIWGMNLDSNLQETKGLFWGVTIGTTIAMGLLVFGIISYLQYTEIIPKKVAIINSRVIRSW
jgi:Mg2+ and Co2+ transporter CorA